MDRIDPVGFRFVYYNYDYKPTIEAIIIDTNPNSSLEKAGLIHDYHNELIDYYTYSPFKYPLILWFNMYKVVYGIKALNGKDIGMIVFISKIRDKKYLDNKARLLADAYIGTAGCVNIDFSYWIDLDWEVALDNKEMC